MKTLNNNKEDKKTEVLEILMSNRTGCISWAEIKENDEVQDQLKLIREIMNNTKVRQVNPR